MGRLGTGQRHRQMASCQQAASLYCRRQVSRTCSGLTSTLRRPHTRSMTPEKWERIKRLFDELASVPASDQDRVLNAMRDEPRDIREHVRRLLDYANAPAALIDGRAFDLIGGLFDEPPVPNLERFTINRRVGAGGMGVVYEGYDTLFASRVAIKTLRWITATSIDMFKREFRSLSQIQHPNLVTLYELFAQDQRWFFTMEFVQGRSFLDYVGAGDDDATPTLDNRLARLRRALTVLVHAVNTLHGYGKLHGDLKPSNVIVTDEGRVVVLDFGLVSDLNQKLGAGRPRAGTLPYMSPEQVRGEALTQASDWYSLGVILHQCLTGSLPEAAADPVGRAGGALDAVVSPSRSARGVGHLGSLCADLLRLRPEDRPSGTEILQKLGDNVSAATDVPAWTPILTESSSLLGRHEELEVLRAAADTARDGQCVIVSVEGQAGVGKSALLRKFVTDLGTASHTTVFEARCYERESVSFNVFDSLMDGISRYLASLTRAQRESLVPLDIDALSQMFPVLGWLSSAIGPAHRPVDKQQLRRAAVGALRELLKRLGRATQLIIVVDDLQWGDVDSAIMLLELLRGSDPPRMLFVMAYRSENRAMSAALRLLLDDLAPDTHAGDRLHFQVEPLARDTAVALATSLLRHGRVQADARHARAIAHESGGNPYFIQELAAHAISIERTGGTFSVDGLTLPAVIEARAERLPEPARRLLELVVISGRPVRSADAIEAALLDEGSPTWLALLRSRQFIRTITAADHEFVEPYHDRLRETILATIPKERRRDGHATLAAALERSGLAEPEVLATHFQGAGESAKAGMHYAAAARQAAAALAFNTAAELYRRVLDLAADTEHERNATLRSLAEALANSGRAFEAADVFRQAANENSHGGVVSLSRAGYHYAASGHVKEAKAAFTEAIARLGLRVPLNASPAVPALLAVRAALLIRGFRFDERRTHQTDSQELAAVDMCWFVGTGLGLVELMTGAVFTSFALYLALRSGDPLRVARGLTWEAAIAASQSRRGKRHAERLFEMCRPIVAHLNDPYASAMLLLTEGQADFSHGRWAGALEKFAHAQELLSKRCTGTAFELATLEGFKLQSLVYCGDYRALRRLAPDLMETARSAGDLYLETFIRGAILPLLSLADDEATLARASVGTALERWSAPGYHLQHALIDQVRLWIELYDDNGEAAEELIERQWPLLRRSHLLFNQNLRAKMLELRARCQLAAAVSRPGHGRSLTRVERTLRKVEREREPYQSGSLLSMRASVRWCRGDEREARRLMQAARKAFDEWEMRDHAAAAFLTLADWTGEQGGSRHRDDVVAWMTDQGIRDPERWARMRIPSGRPA